MTLFAWLFTIAGPLVANVLIGLGIGTVTYVGFDALLADRGYNSYVLEEYLKSHKIEFCSPPKSNSLKKRKYDKHLYKERNLVERFFNLLKQFRRVATRYEKTGQNYLAMIHFASSMILLR